MNKVLLVDDDYIITEAYKKRINWPEIKVEGVYTALNSNEAKSIIQLELPNIVICDIEMQGGSGLELAEWICRQSLRIKIIFLSAYDEFSYAQAALKLNSVEYLVKPASVEDLSAAVKKAIEAYDQELRLEENGLMGEYWLANRNVVFERFWLGIIKGEHNGCADNIVEAAHSAGINIDENDAYALIIFCVVRRSSSNAAQPRALLNDLKNLASEKISKDFDTFYIVHIDNGIFAAVIPQTSGKIIPDVEPCCVRIMNECKSELNVPVICVSAQARSVKELAGSFTVLLKELERSVKAVHADISKMPLTERIILYIAENINEDISKLTVSQYVSMNPDYLSKLFKKETGYSLADYITIQKLFRARRLLLQTTDSVGEIASELGFTNFSYFTKLFKEQFGLTPKEYRRRNTD